LKKFMTVALAALVAVAVAAVAIAQEDPNAHTMTADVIKSKKKGTKKGTKSATVKVGLTTSPNIQPTVDVFTYQFPKQTFVSTKGFKFCTANKMVQADSDDVCPKSSKIGFGTASAFIGSRAGRQLNFSVRIYANKKGATMWLEDTEGLNIRRSIPIQLRDGTDTFNQDLIADIPEDVEYTAGVKVVLQSVDVQLGKHIKRRVRGEIRHFAVVSMRKCPASGEVALGTKLTYKEPPGQGATRARATDPC
jgi:hypothetical protein